MMTVVKFLSVAAEIDKHMAKIGHINKSQSSGCYQNLVNGGQKLAISVAAFQILIHIGLW